MNEILAWEDVLERLDGDQELFFELVDMFFQGYPDDLLDLKHAVSEKSSELLTNKAHAIKSALGNLGAMQCHRIAGELEKMGRTDNLLTAEDKILEFENAVTAFKLACEKKNQD